MQRSDSRLDAFSELISQRRLSGSFSQDLTRLEQDLKLSAEVGLELVSEVTGLKERLNVADAARDQLLDRLAASYRANAALEKRLDRQTAALEAAETSNRSLLATHEDDRKTINRLMADQARTAGMDDKIRLLIRERDDLRQELDAQSRKASVAETKAKRASVRLTDIEARMTSDFTPENTSPVKSSAVHPGKSASMGSDRTARPRKRNPSDTSFLAKASGVTADTAPVELLRLIETLVQQNTSVRNEAQELQAMLDASREEQYAMQNEVMNMQQPWLMETSKESRRRSVDMKAHRNFASELMHSTNSEPIPAMSPTLVDESLSNRQSWSPLLSQSGNFQQQRNPLSSSTSDAGSDHQGPLAYHLPDGSVKPALRSRRSSSKGGPMIRPSSRRAKSVDMTTLYQEDPNGLYDSRNSLEPIADASPVATRQTPSQATPQRPEPDSPTTSRTANHLSRSTATHNSLFNNTQDASSQTELTSDLSLHSPIPFFRTSTPAYSASTTSDEHHFSLSPDVTNMELPQGDRTVGLMNLIEHANKLLTRLKGANVASLEVRLKKQNLPGDVGHLAKSTVKDIMSEIEAMRELFRKLFDQERLHLQTEGDSPSSLVGRRDFFILVRLLRDTLSEIGRLRSIINQVQLDPSLASRIGDLDAGESVSTDQPAPTARGFLAPFSRLFSAGQVSPAEASPKPTLTGLRPSARPVPKQMASSAITSDTVVVKRQVSSTLKPGAEDRLAPAARPLDRKGNDGKLLRSIFAGGSGMRTTSWNSGTGSAAPTGRQMPSAPLTQATDAVLDSFSRTGEEDYRPNLLERQLRPRGLSDSSIRSTFVAHAIPNTIRPANIAISTHAYIPDEDVHATLTTDSLKARDQLSRKFSRAQLVSPVASSPPSSGLPSLSSSPVAVHPVN